MKSLTAISRKFLAEVAKNSKADKSKVKIFVEKMECAGLYGDATEDEIEQLDLILEE